MAGQQHKSKKDLERESRELALTERRVYLGQSVFLTLATAISPFLGAHWTVQAGTGAGAALSALTGRLKP
jgi:hypothetical protein